MTSVPLQKFREIVLQMLYSYDTGHATNEDMLPFLTQELSVSEDAVKQAQTKVDQIIAHGPEIDAQIAKNSESYAFERIHSVERNVLRIGTYELLFEKAIPPHIVIAEAIRLAKKFGSPEATTFVNAILDKIYKTNL